jgi:hypothetical protein
MTNLLTRLLRGNPPLPDEGEKRLRQMQKQVCTNAFNSKKAEEFIESYHDLVRAYKIPDDLTQMYRIHKRTLENSQKENGSYSGGNGHPKN